MGICPEAETPEAVAATCIAALASDCVSGFFSTETCATCTSLASGSIDQACYDALNSEYESVCSGSDDNGDEVACTAGSCEEADSYCNMDVGDNGFCETCDSDSAACADRGLPDAGAAECASVCEASDETVQSVTTELTMAGVTTENFADETVQTAIKQEISDLTSVSTDNIDISLKSTSRRMLQTAVIEAVLTTSDAANVSNIISGDTFATDLTQGLVDSGVDAVSGFSVTGASAPVILDAATTTTETPTTDTTQASNTDADAGVGILSAVGAVVVGLAMF